MKSGIRRVSFFDEIRGSAPSPVTTEHHDDSSNEGEIPIPGDFQKRTMASVEELSSTKQAVGRDTLVIVQDDLDSITLAPKGPTMSLEAAKNSSADQAEKMPEEVEEKKMECEGGKAVESAGDGDKEASQECTTNGPLEATSNGQKESHAEATNEAAKDVSEDKAQSGVDAHNESSGKIDPDGSTACLSKSVSSLAQHSKTELAERRADKPEDDTAEEATPVELSKQQMGALLDQEEAADTVRAGNHAPSVNGEGHGAAEGLTELFHTPPSQPMDGSVIEEEEEETQDGATSDGPMATTDKQENIPDRGKELELEDDDASGRIARTNSHLTADGMDTSQSEAELMQATNDLHSSNHSKEPLDASGRHSLDLCSQQNASLSEEPTSNGVSSDEAKTQPLPTPSNAMDKEASDAAIKAATQPEEVNVSLQPKYSAEFLANKEKEGFGLIARGDSFRVVQQQAHQQDVPMRRHSNQRVPQDPAAVHRRDRSSIASLSRRNSRGEDHYDNLLQAPDENANLPLDDNSWRPSQMSSYPSSPLTTMQAPQAIALNNGSYMVMAPPQMPQIPHHPSQPQHAFIAPAPAMLHHQSSFHSQQQLRTSFGYQTMTNMAPIPSPTATATGGKRKIKLKLQEETTARPSHLRRASFFFGGRSTRKLMMSEPLPETEELKEKDRGTITVSWYEGTSSIELQEHVNRSVERKLKLKDGQELDDIRILDTKMDPPEEIVLCPYIPTGSDFVLRFKIKSASGNASPTFYGPPDSPSAAPSPHPGHLGSLDAAQLATLRKQLDAVQEGERKKSSKYSRKGRGQMTPLNPNGTSRDKRRDDATKDSKAGTESDVSDGDNESDTGTLQPESSVDAKLRQITELLLMDKQKQQQQYRYPRVEKRQVAFVLANYLVLFFAFITILAEMQARAPDWLHSIESQLENVQTCSADQEALFKCVSNGEFAGLFATLILWLSRSAATKQFFLLGFDSPQKLWIVFYESLVGAFCWGVSYMFIRRGMNPDTRPQFLQKYWKDCMYGSLAGFNATFMKAVLKNLIPREAVEEAFNDRQLKILGWLPTFT